MWGRWLLAAVCCAACGQASIADAGGPSDAPALIDGPLADAALPPADAALPPADAGPNPECPGGVQPPLDDCFYGTFFAECGGAGPPVLGCGGDTAPTRDCVWFPGGCAARGFIVSACAANSICCEGNWPFPPGIADSTTLYDHFYGFGEDPWDREREMNLAVVIDPALTAGAPTFACSGTDPFDPPVCGATDREPALGIRDTLTFLILDYWNLGGFRPWLEIDHAATPPAARLCVQPYTDTYSYSCPYVNPYPTCATSGTITLSRIPASFDEAIGMSVHLSVTISGTLFEGSFAFE